MFLLTVSNMYQTFKNLDLKKLPTPCFVIETNLLENNLKILREVADKSNSKILLALKSFSCFHFAPLISQYLDGVCASGLNEARLGKEFFKRQVHTFSAAYSRHDIMKVLKYSNHIIFNSHSQQEFYAPETWFFKQKYGLQVGLRLNPELSLGEVEIYDPSAKGSRLGITRAEFRPELLKDIDGFHFHNLCEQGFEELRQTVEVVEEKFGEFFPQIKWINFGGGHHITKDNYDRESLIKFLLDFQKKYNLKIFLEPGEAVVLGTGVYVAEIIDITKNGETNNVIIDGSCTAHLPDILEMPYRADVLGSGMPNEKKYTYRIGGLSCLAGDIFGDYSFDNKLNIGDKLVFMDMSHYTMVKTNTFNGVQLPYICTWNSLNNELKTIKSFTYEDFKNRLS